MSKKNENIQKKNDPEHPEHPEHIEHIEHWYSVDTLTIDEKMKEIEKRVLLLEKHVKDMESLVHSLTNDNLKMVNRVLEAEISLERAKNSLVRNHIPFRFSPSPLTNRFSL
jgi:SMC interacting uncharacterized protein involved in chromosome segregation